MKNLLLCAAVFLALVGCRDDAPNDCVSHNNRNALMDGEEVCLTPKNQTPKTANACTIYEGEQVCLNP